MSITKLLILRAAGGDAFASLLLRHTGDALGDTPGMWQTLYVEFPGNTTTEL